LTHALKESALMYTLEVTMSSQAISIVSDQEILSGTPVFLLDECLPRKLKDDLPGHDVRTVPEVG
jgi:hypothetical protein